MTEQQTDGGESHEGDANPRVEALETAPRATAEVTVPEDLLQVAREHATGDRGLDEVLLNHIDTYRFRDEDGQVVDEF